MEIKPKPVTRSERMKQLLLRAAIASTSVTMLATTLLDTGQGKWPRSASE